MTNVQEAAARLRRMLADSDDHDGGYPATDEGRQQSLMDHAILAAAFLELVPADDAEAITPEFLKSVGFVDVDSDCLVIRNAAENVVSYLKTVRQFFVQGRGVSGISTRGDLRALLKGLKLPLSPATRQEPT